MTKTNLRASLAALTLSTLTALPGQSLAAPAGADPALVDQGEYLVTAGDCRGCHGENLAGGGTVDSPMGKINALNITPDSDTGIGDWSLGVFTDALRHGRSDDSNLYPAMPYTSYTGLSDKDIAAIYSYLQLKVEPVSNDVDDTELPFPFKRWAMPVWNALNLTPGKATGAVPVTGDTLERGQLLVESLGHCTACHTPRDELLGQDNGRHLAGGVVDGWYAPNITSSAGGLGNWSDEDIASFLRKGHVTMAGRSAVAPGGMAVVISRSLSQLKPDDIDAMVAYLRAVPKQSTSQPLSKGAVNPEVKVSTVEQPQTESLAMLAHDTDDGARLYQSACAMCHGANGQGSIEGGHPALTRIDATRDPDGYNLVQVVSNGINNTIDGNHSLMPAFGRSMTDDQIAATANYVRTTFAGLPGGLTGEEVKTIRAGQVGVPFLIRHIDWVMALGITLAVLAVMIVVSLIVAAVRRSSRR